MWTTAVLLVACLWLLCQLLIVSAATPSAIWSLNQLGAYFNGIFRSIVGPLFGFGDGANNSTSN
ncbi:uncharacterized protein LOC6559734 [Drosophila grimshawi]|uniref:GH19951 n=1 Tax=Drosophila grimshawi TaxID=7222 RepID=B4J8H2_DROGR|nr:uncharacterized protein LOC6559734 [Drosophila grimshawi]EDW02331.1 GH19951 [Drosophila grimshawi]